MGFFEENPFFLVVIIIVTVEAWNAIKAGVRAYIRNRANKRLAERDQ